MRVTNFLLVTHKETPADAEVISHQLMLRAGMIRKLGSGLYTWLPLGLRVLRNIEKIVKQEMDSAGALEVLMPMVQPAELWQESERWDAFGPQLLKAYDRNERAYCLGPTHEEVVTDLVRREIKSYKQLPLNLYQIQTKFRDEIRPRFGIMRAREFMMKDAYSFHLDKACLEDTYQVMYQTYCKIFDRLGLKYRPVQADTGSMGGYKSLEFQVLAESGEDTIFYSNESNYAANIELASALIPQTPRPAPGKPMEIVATPGQRTIEQVCTFLKVRPEKTVKVLIAHGCDDKLVALVLRGDHKLNTIKAEKCAAIKKPFTLASDEEIMKAIGCQTGYIGPVNLTLPLIVDHSAAQCADFICGANEEDKHYKNVNWERDAEFTATADLRNVVAGDRSPDGKGRLQEARGIEVGHIFQLGDKYSQAMQANVLNKHGHHAPLIMGCYGLGVSRIAAAAIEQNHDERGIIWPQPLAPFQISLLALKMQRSQRLQQAAESIYQQLLAENISVLFDDRDERPGAMFADHDLIGIPHRLVLTEKGLDAGTIEYKKRSATECQNIQLDALVNFLDSLRPGV